MFSQFLGKDYHKRIRGELKADEFLLPDNIIDAQLNIGATIRMMNAVFEKYGIDANNPAEIDKVIDTVEKREKIEDIAFNFHCGVLCVMLHSRTKSKPFNATKYKKRWYNKRETFMNYANRSMMELLGDGNVSI